MNISKLAASNLELVTGMALGSGNYAEVATHHATHRHSTNTAGLPPMPYPGSRNYKIPGLQGPLYVFQKGSYH